MWDCTHQAKAVSDIDALKRVETVFICTLLQISSSHLYFRPFIFAFFRLFVFSGSETFDPLGALRKMIFDPPVSMNAIGETVSAVTLHCII